MATIKLGTVPGVYVQEETNPALAISEQRLKTAGLIGHAQPTVRVNNFEVVRGDGATDVIADYTSGVITDPTNPDCIVISDYLSAKGTNLPKYELGVDYTVAVGATGITITWLHSEESAESAESGAESELAPVKGATYYVSFVADRNDEAYKPILWDNLDDIIAFYGPTYYKSGNAYVVNEISTAAKLMFNNGAQQVMIRALKSTDAVPEAEISTALGELATFELQTVLSIPQNKPIHQLLLKQVVTDSATENGKERITWISGAYNGTSITDTVSYIAAYAKSFAEQRVVLVAPNQVTLLLEDEEGDSHEVVASSIYAAAALVGMTTDNNRTVAEPLTRENPIGIYGLKASNGTDVVYTRAQVESLSAAGVTVLVWRNNAASVNQAVTTDISNQNNREVSVVLIKDEVIKTIRYNLDREFIGHYYDRKKTPTQIKTAIMLMLDDMSGSLVQDYDESNIVVTPDATDSTRVNVKMAFAVLRPLNYIYISFMVTL